MKFHAGDRVRILCPSPDGNDSILTGDTGTVVHIDWCDRIGVYWDKNVGGHNCDGDCPDGFGWYVDARDLEIEEDEMDDIADSNFFDVIGGCG